jgi:segregation and condensation protein B
MDDLEDELASVAGVDTSSEPAPEPAPEAAPEPEVVPAPAPTPHHHSPHSGDGTEPDGGTEIS